MTFREAIEADRDVARKIARGIARMFGNCGDWVDQEVIITWITRHVDQRERGPVQLGKDLHLHLDMPCPPQWRPRGQ